MSLTCWELGQHGVPHTLVTDNLGGHLMQHGLVDMVLVGTDRTTRSGDVANKIGTYLKALAAKDNGVPFYAALPSSTFDFEIRDGLKEIPIEERAPRGSHPYVGLVERKRRMDKHSPLPAGNRSEKLGFRRDTCKTGGKTHLRKAFAMPRRKRSSGLFPEKRTSDGRRKVSLSMTDGDVPKHPDWEKLNDRNSSSTRVDRDLCKRHRLWKRKHEKFGT